MLSESVYGAYSIIGGRHSQPEVVLARWSPIPYGLRLPTLTLPGGGKEKNKKHRKKTGQENKMERNDNNKKGNKSYSKKTNKQTKNKK